MRRDWAHTRCDAMRSGNAKKWIFAIVRCNEFVFSGATGAPQLQTNNAGTWKNNPPAKFCTRRKERQRNWSNGCGRGTEWAEQTTFGFESFSPFGSLKQSFSFSNTFFHAKPDAILFPVCSPSSYSSFLCSVLVCLVFRSEE